MLDSVLELSAVHVPIRVLHPASPVQQAFAEFSAVLVARFEFHDSGLPLTLLEIASILVTVCVEDAPIDFEALSIERPYEGISVRVPHRALGSHPVFKEAFVVGLGLLLLVAFLVFVFAFAVTVFEVLVVDVHSIAVHLTVLPPSLVHVSGGKLHQPFPVVEVLAVFALSELPKVLAFCSLHLPVDHLAVLELAHEFSA